MNDENDENDEYSKMNRSTRHPLQAVLPTPLASSAGGMGVVSVPNGMPRVDIRPDVLTPVGVVGHHT